MDREIRASYDLAKSNGHSLYSQGCTLFRCWRCEASGYIDSTPAFQAVCPAYSGPVNLDAMPEAELRAFWSLYTRASRKNAEALFGQKFKGYTSVASDLANYAINKATAMHCREIGNITTAQSYEDICERIYNDLPKFARW